MAKDILMVVGCKGGAGKTTVAKTVVDALLERGENVIAVDADCGNPGLFKTYEGHTPERGNRLVVATFDLSDSEGWTAMVNLADELPNYCVVVDTPGGSHTSFRRYAEILHGSLGELERNWISYFVTNGQRDSTELLRDYLELVPSTHTVYALCNAFFGEARAFRRYQESKTRAELDSRGGASITFPVLAGHVVSDLDWDRRTYAAALKSLRPGERGVLSAWRQQAHRALAPLLAAA